MDHFLVSHAFTQLQEGGFSNDPRDPGGATNRGISLRAVVGLKGENGKLEFDLDGDGDVDADDIRMLGERPAIVEDFYRSRYWTPIKGYQLHWPFNLLTFDAAVNHGVGAASLMLQRACGAYADGKIGPHTIALANRGVPGLTVRFLTERSYLYHQLSVKRGDQFYKGWAKRLFELQNESRRPI